MSAISLDHMFRSAGRYFTGLVQAMMVRYGLGGVHAERRRALKEMRRLEHVILEAKAEVEAAAEAIIEESVAEEMARTAITELKAYGASLSALQASGFRTVGDLVGQTRQSLQLIRGIGEVTARSTLQALSSFQEAARRHVRLLPDPDNQRPADTRLLLGLSRYETLMRDLEIRPEEAQNRFADTSERLKELRSKTRLRDPFFSSSVHTALTQASDLLSAEFRQLASEARKFTEHAQRLHFEPSMVWRRYADNSAPFIVLLESMLSAQAIAKGALAAPDIRGGLPVEIANAVETTQVDLRLLTTTLRRYQQFGTQYIICQKCVLLGDDMGLGKTIQVLAAMCHLAAQGKKHFFVVAPNSVLINWEREVRRHSTLRPIVVHGVDRDHDLAYWENEGGVAITTYTTLSKLVYRVSAIDLLAVDEAHAVKNKQARRTQAVMRLTSLSTQVVFTSGTALENRLSELHTLVTTVQPDLSAEVQMLLRQIRPAPAEVRTKLAPVYLRRTQADVLKELPDLTETDEIISLGPADVVAYRTSPDHLMNKRLAATIGAGARQSAKFNRLKELLDGYQEDGRKVVVFSYFRQVLNDVSMLVGGCPQIHGSISSAERQQILDQFAAQQGFGVIALQIDTGGVGINLQCAQVVILMEPQFKPSTERQAIARVQRMGQTRKVNAHHLIAKGTVDELLVRMVAEKSQIFADYAHHSSVKDASEMAIDVSSAVMEQLQRAVGAGD